ncbi:hypothetical protein G8A07_00105 [Roseateles sp. DAIF2]|uniref:hypothetical protein n=1 Tax=Roseateles sp. DAIF2 TaxID=2714952 RepID=UPI0018A272CE|nr:hypothetical protein [Roseateles sp. DAIF2]QPF71478.1 hypothetical protein G8A07_00105 [Roseateles sp. DAIF2]
MRRIAAPWVAIALGIAGPGLSWASPEPEGGPQSGMVCTVADGWWALNPQTPRQAEQVRVMKVQRLVSGQPGLWIQPLRGPLADYQFQIAAERAGDCRAQP